MKNRLDIKRWQVRIFAACILAYTAAYICRVNFSIAIPGLQAELGLSNTSVGLISTSFFWVYALGQAVNGYLGDKVSSRTFVFIGLLVSALLNLAFGYSSMLWVMIILWSANGIFQSMLWAPLVKTLSYWFPKKLHNKIAFGMSIAVIAGYLAAWASSGLIMNSSGWRWVFWLAAILVLILAFVWYIMARNKPADLGLPDPEEAEDLPLGNLSSRKNKPIKSILNSKLFLIILSGVLQGIVKESILLWSPKLLIDTYNLSLKSTVAIVLIIPLMNFSGLALSGWLNRLLKSAEKMTIMVLMFGSAATSLGLMFSIQKSPVFTVLLLACTSAFIFGTNPLMTAVIPLQYAYCDKVSTVAGLIDFSIYVGAGLAGVLTGLAADLLGWDKIFIMWFLVSIFGALAIYASSLKENKCGFTKSA
jgi:sugar phosphate permease